MIDAETSSPRVAGIKLRRADLFLMFNPTLIVIEAFINELRAMYERTYSTLEPSYPGVISFIAQLALETIATSDAAYHDVNHTILVTSGRDRKSCAVGTLSVGSVTPATGCILS